jgi:ATP-dependent RNA helicase DHX37/DHR1
MFLFQATLRVEDFTENSRLFKTVPPVIRVESRQFETTCHFQKRTPEDYVVAAMKKTLKVSRF